MYNCRYKRCCCQNNFDQNVLETICNDYGVAADYYTKKDDNACNCGFEQGESVFPSKSFTCTKLRSYSNNG